MNKLQRVARASIFVCALAAVVATSRRGDYEHVELTQCPIGKGEPVPCAEHACNDRQSGGVGLCSEFGLGEDLGVPDVLTSANLEGVEGVYLYNPDFETFGTQVTAPATQISDPFWVDVFSDSYLRQDLVQARQLVAWNLPLIDTSPPTFRDVQSGFVYLPIGADMRQILQEYGPVFAINQRSVIDLKATYASDTQQTQSAHTFTMQSQQTDAEADDDSTPEPVGLMVTDAMFFNMTRVQQGTVPELLPLPVARNYVALYFSEALAPDVDPTALITVKSQDADDEIVVGWTVGPDRRAIFGAMVHDDAAFVITFGKKFKSKSGKAFNGANNAAQLAEFGITVEAAP